MSRIRSRSFIFNFEIALILACLLGSTACKRERKVQAAPPQDARTGLINVADPRVTTRLVRGFYGTDNAYWRWTARESSIILNPPKGADQRGAVLVLDFAIVDEVLAIVKSQNLTVAVNGFVLPVQHYDRSGRFTLRQDVPASALKYETVGVDFTLDKALPPTPSNPGGIGIIIARVGLESK